MRERAKAALDSGISLIAFPEGSRTRTGHVREFEKGIFNLAQKFGVPIVPMSIVGSYQFFQTGNWMLFPEKITVLLHDTIETKDIAKAEVDAATRASARDYFGAGGRVAARESRSESLRGVCVGQASGRRAVPARCKPRGGSR